MSTLAPSPYIEVGAMWFPMQGFRPAVWTPPHRDDQVDPARLVPALDAELAFEGKVPPSITAEAGHGYGFVDWPAATQQITAASLSGPVPGSPLTGIPPEGFPLFPPIIVCCDGDTPPGTVIVVPQPPIEQPAQVSVMADAGSLLLCAVVLLYGRRLWRAAGRFGDWFTAERGTGPDQNGWV